MNLCRCEQGHFYDKEKYPECPHCAGGSASDDRRTEAFTRDEELSTVLGAAPGDVSAEEFAATSVTEAAINDAMLDMSNMMAETMTERGSEDTDHTIGIFDDAFSEVSGAAARTPMGIHAQRPAVNKVDTPCVGWLVALGGEHIGTDFRLKTGKNFIGRSAQMDVALTEDKSVSRESHAIIVYEPKEHLYLVQSGESSSLVYLNNKVVLSPVELKAYDMITVGEINLLFMPLCGERFNWGELLEKLRKKE